MTVIFHKISVFFAILITQKETDRNTFEAEVSSKLVFEISLIREVREFLVVYEERERRRNGSDQADDVRKGRQEAPGRAT